jgi:hypothetical protein
MVENARDHEMRVEASRQAAESDVPRQRQTERVILESGGSQPDPQPNALPGQGAK